MTSYCTYIFGSGPLDVEYHVPSDTEYLAFGVSFSLLPLRCGVDSDGNVVDASDDDAGDVSALPMLPCICLYLSSFICFSSASCFHIPALSYSSARPTVTCPKTRCSVTCSVTLEAIGVPSMFPMDCCAAVNSRARAV